MFITIKDRRTHRLDGSDSGSMPGTEGGARELRQTRSVSVLFVVVAGCTRSLNLCTRVSDHEQCVAYCDLPEGLGTPWLCSAFQLVVPGQHKARGPGALQRPPVLEQGQLSGSCGPLRSAPVRVQ
jgi:hypothetical protein